MYYLLAFLLSSPAPTTITVPEVVIVSSPSPGASGVWTCDAPRDLIQGSGTVRTCAYTKGGGR